MDMLQHSTLASSGSTRVAEGDVVVVASATPIPRFEVNLSHSPVFDYTKALQERSRGVRTVSSTVVCAFALKHVFHSLMLLLSDLLAI
jgi:hypothetical protein